MPVRNLPNESVEDAASKLGILLPKDTKPARGSSRLFIGAFWTGFTFQAIQTRLVDRGPDSAGVQVGAADYLSGEAGEFHMVLYFPLDPRIIESDIDGAVRAYPNADNTGWLFAHTDEGTHHDYELTLLAAIDGVFQPFFRQLQVDSISNASATAREKAELSFVTLSTFYGQVVAEARKLARAPFLGEREQKAHPREGWLDLDITNAVSTIEKKWKAAGYEELADIASAITYVKNSLAMPTVETRWDRAARIEKEKKAAEGDGDDGDTS